jgi:hypothetical protein
MDSREKFAAAAKEIAGLGYAPATRAAYLALVAPLAVEGPQLEEEMGHMWSCALTTMGLWRKVGVRHELLERKYVIGQAMAWVSKIGEDFGAEVYPGGGRFPGVGDAVEVNLGNHVVAALTKTYGDGSLVDTVEGGQIDPQKFMCVDAFSAKALRYVDGVLMLGNARVFRWYDCTKLGVGDDATTAPPDPVRDTEPAPPNADATLEPS